MAKLRKWPKGLQARIKKEERKQAFKTAQKKRISDIDKARTKLDGLRKKNRGY